MSGPDFSIVKKRPVLIGGTIIVGGLVVVLLMRSGGGAVVAAPAQAGVNPYEYQAASQSAQQQFQLAYLNQQQAGTLEAMKIQGDYSSRAEILGLQVQAATIGEQSKVALANISATKETGMFALATDLEKARFTTDATVNMHNMQAAAGIRSQEIQAEAFTNMAAINAAMQTNMASINSETQKFSVGSWADVQKTLSNNQAGVQKAQIKAGTEQAYIGAVTKIIGGGMSMMGGGF